MKKYINANKLEIQLKNQTELLDSRQENLKAIIQKRAETFESIIDKKAVFTLRTVGGWNISNPFTMHEFSYNEDKKHFCTKSDTTLNSFFEKEILGYKSRANCIDQAKNKAIGCFFIVTASVAGIVATKLNKEKIKDVHQKLIVGVCATLLAFSTVGFVVFLALNTALNAQLDHTKIEAINKEASSSIAPAI